MPLKNFIAKAEIEITTSIEKIWEALVDPVIIKKYMFGTTVKSDWKAGSSITWSGEWEGKPYKDYGKILAFDPPHHLQYTHTSSSGNEKSDLENVHLIDITLTRKDKHTRITLEQDNNKTIEDKAHSEKNWLMMLEGLKALLEINH